MNKNEYHLIDEIATFLDGLYPDIPIRIDDVEQGFEEPCFFIHVMNSKFKSEPHHYVLTTSQVVISYYPKKHKASACYEMLDELSCKVNRLPEIHIFNKEFEVVDNVLHYAFTATTRLKEDIEEVKQRVLKRVEGELKDERRTSEQREV